MKELINIYPLQCFSCAACPMTEKVLCHEKALTDEMDLFRLDFL